MSKLAFLSDITIVGEEKPKAVNRTGKQYNPPSDRLAIRLHYDGSVFPSAELTEKFNLEYTPREVDTTPPKPIVSPELAGAATPPEAAKVRYKPVTGNGFDVADSQDFPAFKTPQRLLIAALVPKSEGKVDLFSSVGYGEDNKPLVSVMDQGATTFGKDFLMGVVEEVYGVKFKVPAKKEKKNVEGVVTQAATEEVPGVEFVDLVFIGKTGEEGGEPFRLPEDKKVVFLPKKVNRGEKKGESTVSRRVDPEIYVLYPADMLEDTSETS